MPWKLGKDKAGEMAWCYVTVGCAMAWSQIGSIEPPDGDITNNSQRLPPGSGIGMRYQSLYLMVAQPWNQTTMWNSWKTRSLVKPGVPYDFTASWYESS